VTAPMNDRYRRRFPNRRQWPSNIVYGLYAEVKTEMAVNELAWDWAGLEVASNATAWIEAPGVGDEVEAALRAESARRERRAAALAEGWTAGEPGE